jgi:fatty acid-binding protein DegV
MKTAIMTDTNSGFSVQNGLEKDIFVLSMPVIIDEQSYSEGVDITQ